MRNELNHIHTKSRLEQRGPLGGDIDRTTTIRVDHDRRDTLSQKGLTTTQLLRREPSTRVRVYIYETRRDIETTYIDHTASMVSTQITDTTYPITSDSNKIGRASCRERVYRSVMADS